MLRKPLALLLALSLWCCTSRLALCQTTAQTPSSPKPTPATVNPKQTKFAEKVKAHIAKLGAGPGARIELWLRDRTKVKGHVSYAADDHFVVADGQTGITTRMTYAQVASIKDADLNRDREIAIGIVVGLMILMGAGAMSGRP